MNRKYVYMDKRDLELIKTGIVKTIYDYHKSVENNQKFEIQTKIFKFEISEKIKIIPRK